MTPRPANAPKRRHRRTESELIADLQAKIAKLEERKARRGNPEMRLLTKLIKTLKSAEATFIAAGRVDLANSTKAAVISLSGHAKG